MTPTKAQAEFLARHWGNGRVLFAAGDEFRQIDEKRWPTARACVKHGWFEVTDGYGSHEGIVMYEVSAEGLRALGRYLSAEYGP